MKALGQATPTTAVNESRDPSSGQIPTSEKVHLLSIGSVDLWYALHDALTEERNSRTSVAGACREVWMIPDYRDLWVIPRQQIFHAAILHNTLSSLEVDEACRFIRRQWPSAKILVIRACVDFLDDALYEDRIMPGASSDALLQSVDRLLSCRTNENMQRSHHGNFTL